MASPRKDPKGRFAPKASHGPQLKRAVEHLMPKGKRTKSGNK